MHWIILINSLIPQKITGLIHAIINKYLLTTEAMHVVYWPNIKSEIQRSSQARGPMLVTWANTENRNANGTYDFSLNVSFESLDLL